MATQKVTLSLNPEVYKEFRELSTVKGLSISGWVNAKMKKEIDKQYDLKIALKILRKEYEGLTRNVADTQLLNDIVTIFMARAFKSSTLQQMYDALDNLE